MIYSYKQIELPDNKELRCSLFSIFGFGWYKSDLVCTRIGLSYPYFINNLNFYNFSLLACLLDCYSWSDVQVLRYIKLRIMRHIDIRSYKGIRYMNKLPVRGQRTRSNGKSCKRSNQFLKFS